MPREGVSFAEVEQVAETLLKTGQQPTIRAVREKLGIGSPNTIHRHLVAWREARPQMVVSAPDLPASLTNAIASEIARAASQARFEVEDELVRLRAEAIDLAHSGASLEAERDAMAEQVSILTRERDTLAGKAEQQATDLLLQGQRIEREQQAAESARVELATARLKIEVQAEQQSEQAKEIERLRVLLAEEGKARIAAEQQAAVSAARLEATQEVVMKAEALALEAKAEARSAMEEAAELRGKLSAAEKPKVSSKSTSGK